jgi:hypothetical protein
MRIKRGWVFGVVLRSPNRLLMDTRKRKGDAWVPYFDLAFIYHASLLKMLGKKHQNKTPPGASYLPHFEF